MQNVMNVSFRVLIQFKCLKQENIFPFSFINPVCKIPVERHKKFLVSKLGNTNFRFINYEITYCRAIDYRKQEIVTRL
jgi:hypothetical protein